MAKLQLSGKQLRNLGFPEGPVISVTMQIVERNFRPKEEKAVFDQLRKLLAAPQHYIQDLVYGPVAKLLLPPEKKEAGEEIFMNAQAIPYNIFGLEHIEPGALDQMEQASKLPISVAGALMPDAHAGYGLPIGGVLATDNAVIPYGVGVDIGCRMCLSVFDINPEVLNQKQAYFMRELNEATLFGGGRQFATTTDHEVLDNKLFYELALLRGLHDKAKTQLGTSGSGNHFVEFGIVNITTPDEVLKLTPGKYLGLLSHSGSRALGANIADHYTKIAKSKRRLPAEANNLAWLSLEEEAGIEYWLAMNLAGDYASACHHVIHEKIATQLGRQPVTMVENHHNFAWKEFHEGKEVIVHRKGATPAGKNVLGIIPGSMTADGFIVKGKGQAASLASASHGAGRKMSRTAAIRSISDYELKEVLSQYGVKLIGGGLDEAPFAYKDIEAVMKSQQVLVDVIGRFTPKIVKMDDASPKQWRKKKIAGNILPGE